MTYKEFSEKWYKRVHDISTWDMVSACCQIDLLNEDLQDVCDYVESIGIDLINIAYEMKKDTKTIVK